MHTVKMYPMCSTWCRAIFDYLGMHISAGELARSIRHAITIFHTCNNRFFHTCTLRQQQHTHTHTHTHTYYSMARYMARYGPYCLKLNGRHIGCVLALQMLPKIQLVANHSTKLLRFKDAKEVRVV